MALPKFADWLKDYQAPWKNEEEVSAEDAAKAVYSVLEENEKLQDRLTGVRNERDKAKTDLKDAQTELAEAQAKGDNDGVVKDLQKKVSDAESKAEKAELRATRLEVAAEKGVPLDQAKRLQGETREELEADAEEFAKSFATTSTKVDSENEDDEDDDEDEFPVRQPRKLLNSGDGGRGGNESEPLDIDKIVASIPRL